MNSEIDRIFRKSPLAHWQNDVFIFWQLSKPYIWRLIFALFCSLALSGINGVIAWSIKPLLDSIFINKSKHFLLFLPIGVILLFLMRGSFTYLANYFMNSIGAKVVKSLREEIYNKLLTLPLSFYIKTSSGSVVSKMLNDVEILHLTMAHTIKDFFVSGSTVIVLAFVAISRKWDLAILSFIVIPLIIYSIGKLGIRMKKISMNTRKLISRVTIHLHETLRGAKIIKAFTMEENISSRYKHVLTEHYKSIMREVRTKEFSALIAEVLGGVGVAVILFYGGHLVLSDKISPGSFFSFIAALLMIYTPLKRLSRVHNNFQQARTIIERIKEIILVEPERTGWKEKDIRGHIVLKDVSFKYSPAHDYALKDINVEIRQGDLTALVGHSGAGKSTLVDLIAGFWFPTEGNLYMDDVNIRDLSLKTLRNHLGIVTQDIVLFNDTIKANILLGRPHATDTDVIEAAKAAYAHEFIMDLPNGYETNIGELGMTLSAGQRQRITVARAILRNPSILILDEATSSLDIESEQKVQKALERLIAGRTTIVIAHRLSTVQKATKILVMNRGRIVQYGNHEELLLQGGVYQELYTMQFANIEANQ